MGNPREGAPMRAAENRACPGLSSAGGAMAMVERKINFREHNSRRELSGEKMVTR